MEEDENHDDEDDDEIILWGRHVKPSLQWDTSAVFEGTYDKHTGTQTSRPITDYLLAVCESFSVIGIPTLDDDAAYAGHFSNDAGGHHFFDERNTNGLVRGGVEQALRAYVSKSVGLSNARHEVCEDCHMVTIATRDIAKDDEVFVTYGPDYWMEHVSF